VQQQGALYYVAAATQGNGPGCWFLPAGVIQRGDAETRGSNAEKTI
jgi:hypothetical protein